MHSLHGWLCAAVFPLDLVKCQGSHYVASEVRLLQQQRHMGELIGSAREFPELASELGVTKASIAYAVNYGGAPAACMHEVGQI